MPQIDHFSGYGSGLDSPACGIISVAPNDNADLDVVPRALMVATAGDVSVVMRDGTVGVLPALQPGVPYPVRVVRVMATGTSATGIVGLY